MKIFQGRGRASCNGRRHGATASLPGRPAGSTGGVPGSRSCGGLRRQRQACRPGRATAAGRAGPLRPTCDQRHHRLKRHANGAGQVEVPPSAWTPLTMDLAVEVRRRVQEGRGVAGPRVGRCADVARSRYEPRETLPVWVREAEQADASADGPYRAGRAGPLGSGGAGCGSAEPAGGAAWTGCRARSVSATTAPTPACSAERASPRAAHLAAGSLLSEGWPRKRWRG